MLITVYKLKKTPINVQSYEIKLGKNKSSKPNPKSDTQRQRCENYKIGHMQLTNTKSTHQYKFDPEKGQFY